MARQFEFAVITNYSVGRVGNEFVTRRFAIASDTAEQGAKGIAKALRDKGAEVKEIRDSYSGKLFDVSE